MGKRSYAAILDEHRFIDWEDTKNERIPEALCFFTEATRRKVSLFWIGSPFSGNTIPACCLAPCSPWALLLSCSNEEHGSPHFGNSVPS